MIYFFFGSNQYQIKTVVDTFVEKAGKRDDTAIERVDGETFEPAALLDILQGATLFSPKRLVVMRDASKNKPVWEALGERIANIPETLMLVLVEANPDKRTKTYKQLQKNAEVHEAKELAEPELLKWMMTEAARRGGKLDTAVARRVIERAGLDQWRLSNELDKLLAFEEVTAEIADSLVEIAPQANVFALLDAAMQGRGGEVRRLLRTAKATEDPYMLFGLLTAQIMQLAAIVHGQGRSTDDIAKALQAHPYPLKKMSSIAARTNGAALLAMVAAVAAMDDDMKSSGIDPWLLLERGLMKIAVR